MDFVNELGADVVIDYHEQYIRYPLGHDTVDIVFDNLGPSVCGNCCGRSSSPSGIMQIVTSAVRIDVALTLSKSSLFAPRVVCCGSVLSGKGRQLSVA